jgi:tRNA(Ile)-lysidine synthase
VLRNLRSYVGEHNLVRPGDRLGVAVSGGADSVAMFRALVELRAELGAVLSVVHVHHGIRGGHADDDARFVETLARQHDLELHLQRIDVPAYAREHRLSLEAAGRHVRYRYFAELIESGTLDKVATAHTFDDQAETVLLRLIRGSGLQGITGIHRRVPHAGDASRGVVRPLLSNTRAEVIAYLENIEQPWSEDASNADVSLARNRVRHQLLPLLEGDYNPAIRQALVNLADIAREDNHFLEAAAEPLLHSLCDPATHTVQIPALLALPVAMQRKVLIEASHRFTNLYLDFRDIEALRRLAAGEVKSLQLDAGYTVERGRSGDSHVLHFRAPEHAAAELADFEYTLTVPGEVTVVQLGCRLRATLVSLPGDDKRYNPATLLDPARLQPKLTLRNRRPGDHFHPSHSKSPEKLKRLLQEKKIPQAERQSWPVLLSGEDIVWVRGFPVATQYAIRLGATSAVLVEEFPV